MNLQELMEKYGDEKVLVVESRNFTGEETEREFMTLINYYGVFMNRYAVENNLNFKQIIPYVVIKNGDKYFITKRLAGDSRLTGGFSIGQGGHINECDVDAVDGGLVRAEDIVLECVKRELSEETTFEGEPNGHTIDVFIDDSDDVSKVHACILCVVETDQDIKVKETDKLSGAWYTEDEITTGIFDKFENWSKIAYSKLFGRKKPKAAKKEKIIAVNNVKNVMSEKEGK